MRYLDVCSGISAPTQAWKPLGWECVGYSEIDPFACEVLAAYYPSVPNLGDLSELDYDEVSRRVGPVDVLVSGSPCQGFSVAGKRRGLDDPRSSLLFASFALARAVGARWVVWENVPGVISDDRGVTFRRVIAFLCDLGYSVAWRVLDAKWFGVPQRRRRVFVVGHSRDWRAPAAVLFEPESLRRDLAPSRAEGASTAKCLESGSGGSGYQCDGDTETLIPSLADTGSASEGKTFAHAGNNCGRLHNCVPFDLIQVTHPENRCRCDPGEPSPPVVAHGRGVHVAYNVNAAESCAKRDHAIETETARCLDTTGGFAAQQGGTVVAFNSKDRGQDAGELSPTLRSAEHALGRPNGGAPPAIAFGVTVRRLTPKECERLMGCEDDYTLITRANGKPAADGPRYKALGNSMVVNVMRWIGERLEKVDAFYEGMYWRP